MEVSLIVNGDPAELDLGGATPTWSELCAAIEGDLAAKGWTIVEAKVDGVVTAVDAAPPAWGEKSHQVEIEARPAANESARLAGHLRTTVDGLAQQARALGEAFSRGEWKRSLEALTVLLDGMPDVVAGMQLVATAHKGGIAAAQRLLDQLRSLATLIQKQSWVEVSDALLYEIVPLLEQWSQDAPEPPAETEAE